MLQHHMERETLSGPDFGRTTLNQFVTEEPFTETEPSRRPAERPVAGLPRPRFGAARVVIIAMAFWVVLFNLSVGTGLSITPEHQSPAMVALAALLHIPYILLVLLLISGLRERIGYFFFARKPSAGGRLPVVCPKVCVQLPMFNESAVARRAIAAAAELEWPKDRLSIQVLDDSTEADTRAMVQAVCRDLHAATGIDIAFIHRTDRSGYKAGALEAGRQRTDAEFIAIFDADFLPPVDYLTRAVPHFYTPDGKDQPDLALVQAQWGHLNDDESPLTAAQALWVDDHHTLQQSWRSAVLDFVNFTGTAGIWRASAIEAAGGWSSSSLVEDCEISFRTLFAGYRTKFVKEIVVPAELPQTVAAYRSQQKRWTQGWAQLQRLHFKHLFGSFRAEFARKSGLVTMMCISWQWPLWFLWIAIFPFLLAEGLSLAAFGTEVAVIVYFLPPILFAVLSTLAATAEARPTYASASGKPRLSSARRACRMFPYLVINAGMLPHHFCAFVEGLFGPMHAEFVRTPKTAQVTVGGSVAATKGADTAPKLAPRFARPGYALTEIAFVAAQISWILAFLNAGFVLATLASIWLVAGILTLRLAPLLATFGPRVIQPFTKTETK